REGHGSKQRTSVDHVVTYSSFIPEDFITSAHFGASSATKAEKSAGVPALTSAPSRTSVLCMSPARNSALIAALSLSMTDCGVLTGATTPLQDTEAKFLKPLSSSVGTSGICGNRVRLVTASGRTV